MSTASKVLELRSKDRMIGYKVEVLKAFLSFRAATGFLEVNDEIVSLTNSLNKDFGIAYQMEDIEEESGEEDKDV
jgi:hypothetical protein